GAFEDHGSHGRRSPRRRTGPRWSSAPAGTKEESSMGRFLLSMRIGASLAVLAAGLQAGTALGQDSTLVVVLPEAPVILDACNGNNPANGRITRINIYEPLTVVSPAGGEVEPRLATSWERVDDLTWRFDLREGVTFHDGAPFNAQAVLTEIERTLNPDRNCHTGQQYFRDFQMTATAIDDYTLEIKTDIAVP